MYSLFSVSTSSISKASISIFAGMISRLGLFVFQIDFLKKLSHNMDQETYINDSGGL